jgi:hypothetical protein
MHAPLLSSLHLDYQSFQTQAFPFSQIRKLDIHGYYNYATYALEILDRVNQQMDFLSLDLFNSDRMGSTELRGMVKRGFRRVTVSCRSLALECDDAQADDCEIDETCSLFDQMDLVGLETFRLRCKRREQLWPPHKLEKLQRSLDGSLAHLRSLTLEGYVLGEDALISFLGMLPSLEVLRICEELLIGQRDMIPSARGKLLNAMTIVENDCCEVLVPHLTQLSLNVLGHTLGHELVEMVRSRCTLRTGANPPGCAALRNLRWEAVIVEPAKEIVDALRELERPGFHVVVGYYHVGVLAGEYDEFEVVLAY